MCSCSYLPLCRGILAHDLLDERYCMPFVVVVLVYLRPWQSNSFFVLTIVCRLSAPCFRLRNICCVAFPLGVLRYSLFRFLAVLLAGSLDRNFSLICWDSVSSRVGSPNNWHSGQLRHFSSSEFSLRVKFAWVINKPCCSSWMPSRLYFPTKTPVLI